MKSFLPDKLYEFLKWATILALPAIAEFIAWLFPAYDIPNGDLVSETIRRVALLIGILIGVSTIQYNKGVKADIKQIQNDLLSDGILEGDDDDDIEEVD